MSNCTEPPESNRKGIKDPRLSSHPHEPVRDRDTGGRA